MNTTDREPRERETPKGIGNTSKLHQTQADLFQNPTSQITGPKATPTLTLASLHCQHWDLSHCAFPEPAPLKQRWVVITMSDCNILPSLEAHKSGLSPERYRPHQIHRKALLMEWQTKLLSTTLRSLNSGKDHCTSLLSVFSLYRLQSISEGLDSREKYITS